MTVPGHAQPGGEYDLQHLRSHRDPPYFFLRLATVRSYDCCMLAYASAKLCFVLSHD